MKRVLITGMSGTGKSTVISELAARGYRAVDADYGGLSELVSIPATSDRSGLGTEQDWIWREDRIADLLRPKTRTCSSDHIVLLTQTVEPLLRRGADLEIDTNVPVDEVVEKILGLIIR